MKKPQSRREAPEIASFTRYYEHDGMLRAYANRAMFLAILFAVIALSSLGFAIYVRIQPPTVIRVDKDGNAMVVGGGARQDRTSQMAMVLSASAILNIILNCLLLPRIGLQAAALATLVSYLFCTLWLGHLAFKALPLKLEVRPMLGYAVAALAACIAGTMTEFSLPILNLLVKPTVAAIVYCAVLYMLDRRIRDVAARLWRSFLHRSEVTSVPAG